MEKIICKSCGAPNEVEALSGDWFCEYCGNPIELGPDRAKFKDLFSKADDAWDRKDFDDALKLYEQIVALLGGRVAEALFLGDISTGASNDIDRASKLARDMVARYGMCERLGTVSYLGGGEVFIGRDYQTTKSYSEAVAGTIDEEVKLLIDKAYAHCKQILSDNGDKLHQVVEYLLEHENMTGAQFAACMEGSQIGEASDTALLDGFDGQQEA